MQLLGRQSAWKSTFVWEPKLKPESCICKIETLETNNLKSEHSNNVEHVVNLHNRFFVLQFLLCKSRLFSSEKESLSMEVRLSSVDVASHCFHGKTPTHSSRCCCTKTTIQSTMQRLLKSPLRVCVSTNQLFMVAEPAEFHEKPEAVHTKSVASMKLGSIIVRNQLGKRERESNRERERE